MAQPSARTTMKWVPHPSRAFREGWAGDAVGSQTHRQHRSPPLQKTQGLGTHFSLWERKNKAWRRLGHPPQITSYNLHVLGSFPPSLGLFEHPKFTRQLGADTVI